MQIVFDAPMVLALSTFAGTVFTGVRSFLNGRKAEQIKQQTNGNTDKLLTRIDEGQKQIAAQAIEIGSLKEAVKGLLTVRRGPRSTDIAPPPESPA